MRKNILVIGATGFIGKNVVEKLLENNNIIILLVRDSFKVCEPLNNHKSVTIIQADLKNIILIKETLETYEINLVLHLASSLIPSSNLEEFNRELNNIVIPSFRLLEALDEKKIKVIFFSSGGTIYGEVGEGKIQEDHRLQPINYYGHSKFMIESYIKFLGRTKNLNFLIFRPSNVYGKYQRVEAKQGFIAVSIGKILSDSPIEIWGDGESVRDYIDVEDLAIFTSQIINLDVNNEVFNIGSSIGTSLNQIIKHLENTIGKKIEVTYKNRRKVDVDRIVLDIQKLKQYTGHSPKRIEVGIKNFLDFLQVNHEK